MRPLRPSRHVAAPPRSRSTASLSQQSTPRGLSQSTPRQIQGDSRKSRGTRQTPWETRQLGGRFTEGTSRDSYILKNNMGRACFPPYPLSSRLAHARIDGNFLKVAAHRAAGRSTALRKPSACSERGFNAFGDRPQTALQTLTFRKGRGNVDYPS